MADINQDPSMEEILASIKRVIAEDGRAALAGSKARNGGQHSEPENDSDGAAEDDVLELSDPVSDEDRLISEGSAAASRQSLAVLAAMRQQNEAPAPPQPIGEGPLEAVVRDMLRPMLKDWLDQRLPEIVEEMVAREIARITGKSF
jgi:cell pole-organizing protein PopZ